MYKKLLILVLLTGAITLSFAQIRSNKDLVGKWDAKDMQLEFLNNGKVNMIVPGGRLPQANYEADFMKNPAILLITLMDNGQKITYKGNLNFIDKENIRIEYHNTDGSNDSFAKGRIVLFKRRR